MYFLTDFNLSRLIVILNNKKSRFSDIEFDESGIAWLVTGDDSGWVTRFNGDTFESFNSNNSCLPEFSNTGYLPHSIKIIDDETRWIGLLYNVGSSTSNSGVVLMENDICTFYNTDNSNFPEKHQNIKEIHKDPENDHIIWFLSNKGIIKFDGQFWEDIYLPSAPNAMTFDKDNRLWVHISGSAGLKYYKNGEWFMPIKNPSSSVEEMKVDEENRLWVSTETNGLAYYNLDELQSTSTKLEDIKKVTVFPTLFKDNVTVNLEDINLKGIEFNLFDIEGRLLLKESVVNTSTTFNVPQTLKSFFIYTLVKDNITIASGKLFRALDN